MDLTERKNRSALRAAMAGGRYPSTEEQRNQIVEWLFDSMRRAKESNNHSVFGKLTNIWLTMDKMNIVETEEGVASDDDKPQVVVVMPDNGRRLDGNGSQI